MTATEKRLTFDEVMAAWTEESDRRWANDNAGAQRGMAFSIAVLSLLAQGKPASPAKVVEASGLSPAEVEEIFAKVREHGGEFDEAGNLIGLALTHNPTSHRFRINDRTLYTWCSLDAIFLPGLLDKTAQVESTCPETGEAIRLTVTPEGVADYDPATTILSITVPGLSCRREDDASDRPHTGPGSDSCGQMFFFASREAGEGWLVDHPGVVLWTPEEAYQLARINWIERYRKGHAAGEGSTAGDLDHVCL